jgi:hypothetical protein
MRTRRVSIKAFIDKSESRVAGISARQVIGFAFESRSGRIRIAFGSQAYRRDRSVNQTVGISAQSVIGFGGLG